MNTRLRVSGLAIAAAIAPAKHGSTMATELPDIDVGSECPVTDHCEHLLFGKPDGGLYCSFHGTVVEPEEPEE